jgi:hypothetical protein
LRVPQPRQVFKVGDDRTEAHDLVLQVGYLAFKFNHLAIGNDQVCWCSASGMTAVSLDLDGLCFSEFWVW